MNLTTSPQDTWPLSSQKHSSHRSQGWAGIPVPVHSQEWKPLISFPELWEWIFSFPSLSRISGMFFFHSPPVPELWIWVFSFPSRSRIVGMDFFHSLPVPELWNWIFLIPFPFPNLLFHRRESKRELYYCKRYQASNFFSFLYISQSNYIEEENWAKMFKSEWLKRQDILLSFVANSFAVKVLVIVNKIILFWFLFIKVAVTTWISFINFSTLQMYVYWHLSTSWDEF